MNEPECKCPCHYGGMDAEGLVKQPCNLCTCDMDNDPIAQQATAAYNRVTDSAEIIATGELPKRYETVERAVIKPILQHPPGSVSSIPNIPPKVEDLPNG